MEPSGAPERATSWRKMFSFPLIVPMEASCVDLRDGTCAPTARVAYDGEPFVAVDYAHPISNPQGVVPVLKAPSRGPLERRQKWLRPRGPQRASGGLERRQKWLRPRGPQRASGGLERFAKLAGCLCSRVNLAAPIVTPIQKRRYGLSNIVMNAPTPDLIDLDDFLESRLAFEELAELSLAELPMSWQSRLHGWSLAFFLSAVARATPVAFSSGACECLSIHSVCFRQ